ncbi:MAG: hypothetical protein RIS54_1898 [Verrucomicrobiota bacterium]|jgi:hypothetical protein
MIALNLVDGRLKVPDSPLWLALSCSRADQAWQDLPLSAAGGTSLSFSVNGVNGELRWSGAAATRADFELAFESADPVRLRLALVAEGEERAYHVIPACLLGDNNHDLVRPKEFPTLHEPVEGNPAAAPLWEFRADRAACPVSLLCLATGVAGLAVAPYANDAAAPEGFIRNGVFAALPATAGVSLGYGNDPLTFVNKQNFGPPTAHRSRAARTTGSLFWYPGAGREGVHRAVRDLYGRSREQPAPRRSAADAVQAITECFAEVNWSAEFGNYSNLACRVPTEPVLKAWRPVSEIGWTGGGVFAWPLLRASARLPEINLPKTAAQILDEIVGTWNERSGFFNDVAGPSLVGIPGQGGVIKTGEINGWWSGFMPHTMNRHCAYTNGHAAYYLLKCARWVRARGGDTSAWETAALKVCDAVIELQRADGAFGYLFSAQTRKVVDWDGFAGCWFAAALPLAFSLTQDERYLRAARRALRHYRHAVAALNCYGTPMDTYKSVDQEGILAFVQAARWLHEVTGEDEWLDHLRAGADYELLWRYAYRARPEFAPLKDAGWNSCGGSVTSVSNPHIHPMGLVITEPLHYLARVTGDTYYRDRADDGVAWALATLELYPEISGYGRYGLLTERYCPSDGLVIETFADTGSPSSLWWTYNAWAAANILEGLLDLLPEAPVEA